MKRVARRFLPLRLTIKLFPQDQFGEDDVLIIHNVGFLVPFVGVIMFLLAKCTAYTVSVPIVLNSQLCVPRTSAEMQNVFHQISHHHTASLTCTISATMVRPSELHTERSQRCLVELC